MLNSKVIIKSMKSPDDTGHRSPDQNGLRCCFVPAVVACELWSPAVAVSPASVPPSWWRSAASPSPPVPTGAGSAEGARLPEGAPPSPGPSAAGRVL